MLVKDLMKYIGKLKKYLSSNESFIKIISKLFGRLIEYETFPHI